MLVATEARDHLGPPPTGSTDPAGFRCDVCFLKPPLTSKGRCAIFPTRDGVDEASAGQGALYVARLVSRLTQAA